MNLLDENIPLEQRDLLRAWGIHCRIIGQDISEASIGDDNIFVLLHRLRQTTLFTRDHHFFDKDLCHARYALVYLDIIPEEVAIFARRFLKHPRFRTKTRRMGTVARVHHDGVHFWQRHHPRVQIVRWPV